jgi:hypothetical protein
MFATLLIKKKKMKKVLYTLLAVSIIFASCKKEEDEVVAPVAPSIVGTWTPTSAAVNYTVTMGGMMLMDTSYAMTPSDEEWEFTDVEFTADGQMIMEGESNSYSHSGNTLTITEDGETETNTCTVTSTNMVVIINDSEEEDGMTITSDITLNHTRQ